MFRSTENRQKEQALTREGQVVMAWAMYRQGGQVRNVRPNDYSAPAAGATPEEVWAYLRVEAALDICASNTIDRKDLVDVLTARFAEGRPIASFRLLQRLGIRFVLNAVRHEIENTPYIRAEDPQTDVEDAVARNSAPVSSIAWNR